MPTQRISQQHVDLSSVYADLVNFISNPTISVQNVNEESDVIYSTAQIRQYPGPSNTILEEFEQFLESVVPGQLMDEPIEEPIIEPIVEDNKKNFLIRTDGTTMSYERLCEIITEYYGESRVHIDENKILIHFPEVTIRNNMDMSHDMKDLFFRITLNTMSNGHWNLYNINLAKTTYTLREYLAGYCHSHVGSRSSSDYTYWASPCFGSTILSETIRECNDTYTDEGIIKLLMLLDIFITYESAETNPYILMGKVNRGLLDLISDKVVYNRESTVFFNYNTFIEEGLLFLRDNIDDIPIQVSIANNKKITLSGSYSINVLNKLLKYPNFSILKTTESNKALIDKVKKKVKYDLSTNVPVRFKGTDYNLVVDTTELDEIPYDDVNERVKESTHDFMRKHLNILLNKFFIYEYTKHKRDSITRER